jgi:vanillate O-demethylase monooxygenase subunit
LFNSFKVLLRGLRPLPIEYAVIELSPQEKHVLAWYAVAETSDLNDNKPHNVNVWGKDYVIWKTSDNKYNALEDICPHRGVPLSRGCIIDGEVQCPYHGFQFSGTGNLTKVPGMNFQPSPVYNAKRFTIVDKYGWLFLNTFEVPWNLSQTQVDDLSSNIFVEPEATDPTMALVRSTKTFDAYARVVSENSLDIMHIGYVHTFGNKENPSPIFENPPKMIGMFHYKTSYLYESGRDSMVKKVFHTSTISIDNEFILPHSTVARVKFGNGFTYTVITSACPINATTTRLFVKSYRNFFRGYLFDLLFKKLIDDTLLQDKNVIDGIKNENIEGKFNMKFDKLQNTYRTFYRQHIHRL